MISALLELDCKVDLLLLNRSEYFNSSKTIKARLEKYFSTMDFSAEVRRHPNFIEYAYKRNKSLGIFIKFWARKFRLLLASFFLRNAAINGQEELPERFKKLLLLKMKRNYDIIWFNYAKMCPDNLTTTSKVIIDLHDLQKTRIVNEVLPKIKCKYIANKYIKTFIESEKKLLSRADLCITISSSEEKEINASYCPSANTITINGTDTEHYIEREWNKRKYDLIFVGSNSFPNEQSFIWFIKEVWPKVSNQGYKLLVQGNIVNNQNVLVQIKKAPQNENIALRKFSENLKVAYEDSKLAICPVVIGTGMKIKVVEALSYGLPIVATSIALDGIPKDFGLNGCDSPEEFANCISETLRKENYEKQSQFSRKTFEECLSHSYLINQLKVVLKQLDTRK